MKCPCNVTDIKIMNKWAPIHAQGIGKKQCNLFTIVKAPEI